MKNGREWIVPALWVVLPCLIFAIPKTKLITYVYPSYIGLYVCGGLVLPGIVKQAKSVLAKVVLAVACCFGVLLLSFNVKADYKRIAGETTDSFEELLLEHAELFSGEGNISTISMRKWTVSGCRTSCLPSICIPPCIVWTAVSKATGTMRVSVI